MRYKRISLQKISGPLLESTLRLETYLKDCSLDRQMLQLVTYRISQINGCVYSMAEARRQAILLGESCQRLERLSAWRQHPLYAPHERALLAYAEVLTLAHAVEDRLFETLKYFFSLSEIVELTMAITRIHSWNRINKALGGIGESDLFQDSQQVYPSSQEVRASSGFHPKKEALR